MAVPFEITCASCHARLTVKNASLIGKRVACPRCKAPMIVRPQTESIGEAPSAPLAESVFEMRAPVSGHSSASGVIVTAHPDAQLPTPTESTLQLPATADFILPAPVTLPLQVDGAKLPGIPVIREVAKSHGGTKSSQTAKKKGKNKTGARLTRSLWVLGAGVAGSVAGIVALVIVLVGPSKNTPPSKPAVKSAANSRKVDEHATAFDVSAPPAFSTEAARSDMKPRLKDIVEAVGDAVVCITVADRAGQEVALGTGVLFDPAGLLVTNYHVIENAAQAQVYFRDGRRGEIAGYRAVDEFRDLAILQLAESTEPISFLGVHPAVDVQQGEEVVALGHPAGLKFTLTNGIVSAVRLTSELPSEYRRFLQSPPDQIWIQTTAAISGGNSGGPLLNERGELAGINTWVAEGENLGFAIHVRHLAELVNAMTSDVIPLPVKTQPAEYRPNNPLVIELQQQFRADFENFVVRIQSADRDMAGAVLEAYNPATQYMQRFLELAEQHRGQATALEALTAVCSLSQMSTEGTTFASTAYERLVQDHVDDANLRHAIIAAGSDWDPSARTFLERVVHTSSDRELKGIAAFALAGALLSNPNLDNDTEAQATELLQRVIDEFGDVPWNTTTLGAAAEQTRFEAEHLSIGKPAMEVTGIDQDGNELKMSDYRGKVVVLDFWADWCPHCRVMYPHERVLVEEYEGRPFVLLGVSADERSRFDSVARSGQITWRSCWDGPRGPIAKRWQVNSFPTIYVLDHQGVIRFKDLRDNSLAESVQMLVNLAEVESLVAQNPDQPQHLAELARCHSELANAYTSLEEWRSAAFQQRAAVDCLRRLTASHPGDAEYRRRFATALVSLSQAASTSLDLKDAAEALDEARGSLQSATDDQADRVLLLDILSRLGGVAQQRGDYGEAVRHLRAAVEFAPESADALNSLAWILATCPDEQFRNGDEAARLAEKACESTRWESYAIVDTLAAALAEQGKFDEAVQQQRKAVRLAPPILQASMNSRVKLYQGQTPYRLARAAVTAPTKETQVQAETSGGASRTDDPIAATPSKATAQPAVILETSEQARKFLQEKRIRLSSSGLALEDESKLSQGLRDIKSDRASLFKAEGELQKLLSAEIDLNRNISNLRQRNVQLNAQLATIGPTDITLNNQLVGALNASAGQIQLLTENKSELGEAIKVSRGKMNSAREAYIQRLLELRALADAIHDQYQQLEADKDVQAALQLINAEYKKDFQAVVSGRFKADERELKKLEDKVLSETIPLRDERGTLYVSAVIDGKHNQEFVVDSGASLVSLPHTMALACGIRVKPSDPKIELQLADGSVIEGNLVTISSIRVGKFTVNKVEAVVLGPNAVAAPALLGMSFLAAFKFEIDAQAGRLTMVEVDTSGQ